MVVSSNRPSPVARRPSPVARWLAAVGPWAVSRELSKGIMRHNSHLPEAVRLVHPQKKTPAGHAPESVVDAATLESLVGYNLRRAASKQRERFRSAFDPYDIRPVQLSMLVLIGQHMPVKQAELGRALEMKRANVVTVLDELIRRRLVSRRPSAEDRRSNVLTLTAEGQRLTQELLERHDRLEQGLARTFGKQRLAELVELLQAFRLIESDPELD